MKQSHSSSSSSSPSADLLKDIVDIVDPKILMFDDNVDLQTNLKKSMQSVDVYLAKHEDKRVVADVDKMNDMIEEELQKLDDDLLSPQSGFYNKVRRAHDLVKQSNYEGALTVYKECLQEFRSLSKPEDSLLPSDIK